MTPTDQTANADPLALVPRHFRKGEKRNWHQRRRRNAVLRLLHGLPGRVLDYGCGYGDLAHAISNSHDVVGCDVDPTRVEFAKREYAPIEFSQCAASGAPYADQSFDIVVSSVVIHFVADQRAYLNEIRRLLRPNGHLLIVFRNEAVVRNTLRRMVGKGKSATWLWIVSMSEAKSLLAEAGFEVLKSTYFYDPPLSSWRNLGDWLVGPIEQFCSMMRIKGPAGYHAFLTRVADR